MDLWLRLGRALDRLGDVFIALSALMLFLMMLLLGVEIGDRALFRSSTQIADEYSGYLFTWLTICSFLYAQRSDRFLRVDALRTRLPPHLRAAADGVAALLAATLTLVLVYATWAAFRSSMMFSSVSIQPSQTLLAIPQVIMPTGLLLLALAFTHSAITAILQALGRLPIAASVVTQPVLSE